MKFRKCVVIIMLSIILLSIQGFAESLQDSSYKNGLITYQIIENNPPTQPVIIGPKIGIIRKSQEFTFNSTDPDGDDVYYLISWGDGDIENWVGPYESGKAATFYHVWMEPGDFTIVAMARDQYEATSSQNEFGIMLIKNRVVTNLVFFNFLEKIMEHFPFPSYLLNR